MDMNEEKRKDERCSAKDGPTLVLSIADYPNLLSQLRTLAKLNVRTPEHQAIWMILDGLTVKDPTCCRTEEDDK